MAAFKNSDFADTVLHNGKIYSVDPSNPWAQAIAIRDGKIVVLGADSDVRSMIGSDTRVIDLKGKMVMPGINDVHVHPILAVVRIFSNVISCRRSRSMKFSRSFAPMRARPSPERGLSAAHGEVTSPARSRPSMRCARSMTPAKAIRFCCAMTACTIDGSIRARSKSPVSTRARRIRTTGSLFETKRPARQSDCYSSRRSRQSSVPPR